MFSRTPTLGTVSYKGQRAQIISILLKPEFPSEFSLQHVLDAVDKAAYRKTFKSETSIPKSVQYHLGELVKLGQLDKIPPDGVPKATIPVTKPQPGAKMPDTGGGQGPQPSFNEKVDSQGTELLDMAREWYGYGRWDAPYWFVGQEPGMGPSEDNDLRLRCRAWMELGAGELVDCREHHFGFGCYDWHRDVPTPRQQKTWTQLIRLLLALRNGSEPTSAEILAYQQRFWGMRRGETCVIELCSLAAHDLKTKKGVAFNPNTLLPERIRTIQRRISHFRPALLLMYGALHRKQWERIVAQEFPADDILQIGPTTCALAKAPASYGLSNAYWLELAQKLRSRRLALAQ